MNERPEDLRQELSEAVTSLASALRLLPAPQLEEPVVGFPSRADAARSAAQALAHAASRLQPGHEPAAGQAPESADVGDVVQARGEDLLLAYGRRSGLQPAPEVVGSVDALVREALQHVREIAALL